jgi:hypothetical protein
LGSAKWKRIAEFALGPPRAQQASGAHWELEKNIFKKWKILKAGRGVSKDHENTTNRPQKHHKKPSQNTHFSQKPPKKHTSGHPKK